MTAVVKANEDVLQIGKMDEILKKQLDFFNAGNTKSIAFRKKQLKKLSAVILKRENEICDAIYKDLHKHPYEAFATEIGTVLKEIQIALKNIDNWTRPKSVDTPLFLAPAKSYVYNEAYGIVLIIAPWNFPFQLQLLPLVGAIAAGNVVVCKPSEYSPNTDQIIKSIITEVFDEAHVSVFNGDYTVGKALLERKWDHIFFTGSSQVGKIVYQAAAKNLTPVTLELGGKCPVLVDENIGIKNAVKRLVWGKFTNAGQICLAANYLFVHKNVKDKLIAALIKEIQYCYGTDAKTSENYGRIINEKHFDKLNYFLENNSNPIIYGGASNKSEKYIEPTIIEVSDLNDKIMHEELFGPILPVYVYSDVNEIFDYIKSQPKPLASYIFSRNKKLTNRFLTEISSGGASVNDLVMHMVNGNMSFGGVGASGIGGYHGKTSFETFSHQKSVLKNQFLIELPIRFAPYKFSKKLIAFVMKWLG